MQNFWCKKMQKFLCKKMQKFLCKKMQKFWCKKNCCKKCKICDVKKLLYKISPHNNRKMLSKTYRKLFLRFFVNKIVARKKNYQCRMYDSYQTIQTEIANISQETQIYLQIYKVGRLISVFLLSGWS